MTGHYTIYIIVNFNRIFSQNIFIIFAQCTILLVAREIIHVTLIILFSSDPSKSAVPIAMTESLSLFVPARRRRVTQVRGKGERDGKQGKERERVERDEEGGGVGGHYVDVIQKRERMLHLLKRLPRKIAVSRMATSLGAALLPSATVAGSYAAVIIIVPVPLQQAFELRRVYIQFVSRNYNLLGIGAADDAEELRAALLFARLRTLGDRYLLG